jgi:hypothetical protein
MGGVLKIAGIPGFLGNLNELYEAADTDGQMWREFTGAWWEAYRELPKKVSELNQFCEERDLMGDVRGDGLPRSQQTRLGKALGAKRDRVFNGLTVKRISQGERKHGVLYALAPADGGNRPDGVSRRDPDLLDLLEGNVGNVGNLFPSSRAEKKEIDACIEAVATESENINDREPETGTNVPHVPLTSATKTKDATCVRGTFGTNVPLTFPPRSPATGGNGIDLAKLPENTGKDPP